MKKKLILLAGIAISLAACSDAVVSPDVSVDAADKVIGDQGGRPLTAVLSGASEVPANGSQATGSATVTLNQGLNEVCWEVSTSGLTPTASHIHRAPAGVNGPVVVNLSPSGPSWSGCREVDSDLIKEIRQHPEEFYINVHTAAIPSGEIRGQLSK